MKKVWIILIISSLVYSNSLLSQDSNEVFESKLFDLIKYDQKFVPDYFNGDSHQTISITPSLNFMLNENIALKLSGSQFLNLNKNETENDRNSYAIYELYDIGIGYFLDKNKEIALNAGVIHNNKINGYNWDLAFKFYLRENVYFSSGIHQQLMNDKGNTLSFYVGSGFRIF